MKTTNRPLSPHLQIYKMPLSAKLSILHRITGLALSAGAVVLVLWLYCLAYASTKAVLFYQIFSSTFGKVLLLVWIFAFCYHFYNGIRHMFWDVGKGFDLSDVNKSGWLVVVLALISTAVIWIVGA